jgi:hypothetical protein
MARLRNGKLIDGNFHSGAEILKEVPRGRRGVEISGKVVKNLDPRKNYSPEEIQRKIRTMPDRSKGSFFGPRSQQSKKVIQEQILNISENLFKNHSDIDYDDENFDWMVIENYSLPPNWSVRTCALMIIFPTEYPQIPPVGFYLPKTLKSPTGHLFDAAYHNATDAPIEKGWRWYCTYIEHGSWQPSMGRYPGDWQKGDNLWDYFTLVGEVLAGGEN